MKTERQESENREIIEIVKRVLAGQRDDFGEIIRRYQVKIFGMAIFHTRNATLAEELTQEIFVQTFQSLPRFDQTKSFTNWILRIATNHCYKSLRRKPSISLDGKEIPLYIDPLDDHVRQERRQMVMEALSKLPEEQKLVIWMFYFFERSYEQISEILEMPLHLVKIRLFRGKKALGELLRKTDPHEFQEGKPG